jgi:endonuclease G
MKICRSFFLLLLYIILPCKSQELSTNNPLLYFLPKITDKTHLVIHTAFVVEYSHTAKDPVWVAYYLTGNEAETRGKRHGQFRPDPAVPGGTASLEDYRRSGYDRGHQAPAADFKWNPQAEEETFLLSNICPQNSIMNRGVWEHLENHVRRWAEHLNHLYIVTGPLLDMCLDRIGRDGVCVPRGFFKVVLDCNPGHYQAIAFIMRNTDLPESDPIENYAVKVDSVEKLTGIRFFAAFPDSTERRVDTTLTLSHWQF